MKSLVFIRSLAISVCIVRFLQANPQSSFASGEIQIHFTGNKVFSHDQLISAMQLAVRPDLNGSTDDGIGRDEFKKGADRIREFIVDQGYLISEVGAVRLERSNQGIGVIIPITEGPLFRVGRVRFENSTLFSQEQLLEIFGVKEGEIAASFGRKNREGFERLKRLYSNHGYLNWTIIPKIAMNDDKGTVDCTFRLEEGPVFSIRRITFTGGTTTNEQALRTQLLIGEGQVFNWQLLDEGLLRVHQLGLTEEIKPDNVTLQIDESTHQVDVTINLKESTQVIKP